MIIYHMGRVDEAIYRIKDYQKALHTETNDSEKMNLEYVKDIEDSLIEKAEELIAVLKQNQSDRRYLQSM